MKLLWVKSDFLHPTTRGAQIRSLGILRQLHQRHEIHYVALTQGDQEAGIARSREYCSHAYPVPHYVPEKASLAFAGQLLTGLFSRLPVAVSRYRSPAMRRKVEELIRREKFDRVICDFLFMAPNIPDLDCAVLFQHNVEAVIWRRRVEQAPDFVRRRYFQMQARRMLDYEGLVCRQVKSVIAVSEKDAATMRNWYGVSRVGSVPTGVDLELFASPKPVTPSTDLVFLGSMDWMPNAGGIVWFVNEVLPLIRRRKPGCSMAIVGRKPSPEVVRLARKDPAIQVTGTVPDVRPWLWQSRVSIVPLQVGGGTRLKIYEAMAAKIPVVSTTVGAEGLDVSDGDDICIADSAEKFAERCLWLMEDSGSSARMARTAWEKVASRYSWEAVSQQFELQLVS